MVLAGGRTSLREQAHAMSIIRCHGKGWGGRRDGEGNQTASEALVNKKSLTLSPGIT